MKCNIEEVIWNDERKYYCATHRSPAFDKDNNKLEQCLSKNKSAYDNIIEMKKEDIKEIVLIYPNLLESVKGKILINDREIGILKIDNSIFEVRDFGGLLLSLLNDITLKEEKCPICGHIHSDDGKFAYSPHDTHLCMYCGNLFDVKEANVGNELSTIFDIPKIELKNNMIDVKEKCTLKYNVLKGSLEINEEDCNKIILNKKEYLLVDYLNKLLYDEY